MTEFNDLPKGGEAVSVVGYDGVVVRQTKVAGGLEITIQLNDEDDETPISGPSGFTQETDREGKKAYAENAENAKRAANGNEDEEDEEEKPKAPAAKPVAKPVAPNSNAKATNK